MWHGEAYTMFVLGCTLSYVSVSGGDALPDGAVSGDDGSGNLFYYARGVLTTHPSYTINMTRRPFSH